MFCPQCGTDSAGGQHYCRSCGTNLKVVGRAVSLGDAISQSDGVPGKVKEIMSSLKIAHVTDEVSRAMEKVNAEITRSSAKERFKRRIRRRKTAAERRERYITKGTIKFFSGTGLSIFLYFLFHGIVLKLDPDLINKVPFEIESVVRLLWIIGLVPVLSGVGHIIAGLSIKARGRDEIVSPEQTPLRIDAQQSNASGYDSGLTTGAVREPPPSIADRTTNILDRDPQWQK
ncbi:MAG: zinc ribbon domain-containing protein [Pyrinomonadaceae bacterium]